MSIHQLNMYGMDMVEVAMERLKAFEPKEGYFLAFSGGGIGRRMGCSGDGNTDKNVRYCSQGFNSQQPEQTSVHVRCKSLPAEMNGTRRAY